MDRIREAISRARVGSQPDTPVSKAVKSVNGTPTLATSAAQKFDDFATIEIDDENFAKNRIIANEQDPILSAYRVLRTRTLQRMQDNDWHTLAVISPSASAGKTVTAINLAIALSTKPDLRPTLVDLDFYRPSVSRYLGLQDPPSLLNYFEEKAALNEVMIKTSINNLNIIPNERVTRRGAEHLTSQKFDTLVDQCLNKYGSKFIIFDMSPLLGCDDTIAVLPKIDSVLVVAASGQTKQSELRDALRLIPQEKIVGTVLNKMPGWLMPNQYY